MFTPNLNKQIKKLFLLMHRHKLVLKYHDINYTYCWSELPVSQGNLACHCHQLHEGRSPSIRRLAGRHRLQRPSASRRRCGACAHPPLRITSDIPSPGMRRSTKTNQRLYILRLYFDGFSIQFTYRTISPQKFCSLYPEDGFLFYQNTITEIQKYQRHENFTP